MLFCQFFFHYIFARYSSSSSYSFFRLPFGFTTKRKIVDTWRQVQIVLSDSRADFKRSNSVFTWDQGRMRLPIATVADKRQATPQLPFIYIVFAVSNEFFKFNVCAHTRTMIYCVVSSSYGAVLVVFICEEQASTSGMLMTRIGCIDRVWRRRHTNGTYE